MRSVLLAALLACKSGKGTATPEVDTGTDAGVDTGTSSLVDADGDGFDALPGGDDCDDANRSIHPDAVEQCGDGVDQDCDGVELGCSGLALSDSHRALSGVSKEQLFGHSVAFLPESGVLAVGSPGVDGDGGDVSFEGAAEFFSLNSVGRTELRSDKAAIAQLTGSATNSIVGEAMALGGLGGEEHADLVIAAPGNGASYADEVDGVFVLWDLDRAGFSLSASDVTQLTLPLDPDAPGFAIQAGWDVDVIPSASEKGSAALSLGMTGGCRDGGEGGVMIVPTTTIETRRLSPLETQYVGEKPCWTNHGYHKVGDLDGDGITDLVTAARSGGSKVETIGGEYTSDGMGAGYVYVVHGPLMDGGYLADADGRIEGAHAQALMGRAVGVSQDLDGDGYPEVLAGAAWENHAEDRAGSAYVIPGPDAGRYAPAGDVATVHVQGDEEDLWLGYQVADGGDQDADGHRELLVTSMREDSSGEVSVFRGPLAGTLTRDDAVLRMVGTAPSYNLGSYPDEAGGLYAGFDLNDDGYDDWIAGARRNDADGIGSLHVMFGGVWE